VHGFEVFQRYVEFALVSRTCVLIFRVDRDYGGHFACMECPKEMVEDMREFFGAWYKADD
jgi:hypothetical protein